MAASGGGGDTLADRRGDANQVFDEMTTRDVVLEVGVWNSTKRDLKVTLNSM
uniref:Uncharacterized protein n=1 Tax=Oryza sativa subsp. japonica TaxID=39947 RepID=Q5Z4B2_ORYSJ|nr:hypothetical protein [Oryza sativa Japonica Group]BAD62420.1 hypothetical protein [Oryza sativa Japonica Group]